LYKGLPQYFGEQNSKPILAQFQTISSIANPILLTFSRATNPDDSNKIILFLYWQFIREWFISTGLNSVVA